MDWPFLFTNKKNENLFNVLVMMYNCREKRNVISLLVTKELLR